MCTFAEPTLMQALQHTCFRQSKQGYVFCTSCTITLKAPGLWCNRLGPKITARSYIYDCIFHHSKRACNGRIKHNSESEPLQMSLQAAARRARQSRYSWEICSASAAVFFIHFLFLQSQIMTRSRGQRLKWVLVLLLSWRRNRGERNAPHTHTHTDALNHSWQKGPLLLMCVKRLQGFYDFVILLHFELNFTRVALFNMWL